MIKYKIYKATNKENGKVYFGQTTKTLEERKIAHKNRANFGSHYYFHNAVRKYGIEGFLWEVLHDDIPNQKEADKIETELIDKFKSTNRDIGYNLATGGGGGDTFTNNPRKEEIREYLRKINTGKKMSEETKKKMSKILIGNTHTLGHTLSEAHKKKISEGHDHHSPPTAGKSYDEVYGIEKSIEIKRKISQGGKGRVFSKEHRDKIGLAHKGKIVSEETKAKIRLSKKGQIPPTAKLNPDIVKELRLIVFPSKPDNKSWNLFYKELSDIYKISASVIRKIRYNDLWKWI